MTVILNAASGVLHLSPRCAGRDTRFHLAADEPPGEELLAVSAPEGSLARVGRRCRKCLGCLR